MFAHQRSARVVVLGGGYAGTTAANRLRARAGLTVTLVNPRPEFVERIRLHQLVAGTAPATVDYEALLGPGVELIVDDALRIDVDGRCVELSRGAPLFYDYVVYAVGSTGSIPTRIAGAKDHAYSMADLESAQRLWRAVGALATDAPLTVVGGGLTGIETAAELAEQGRRVQLLCGAELGPSLSRHGRRAVAGRLDRLGVEIAERASVTGVGASSVVLKDGTTLPSAVTAWAAGFGVPSLAGRSGLAVDSIGRMVTDRSLVSIDDGRIVAAGDAAAPKDMPLRMSCQAAIPLGARASDTVLSAMAGTEPVPLRPRFVGQCISLGRREAAFQVSRPDDTPTETVLHGRPGALVKEAICRGTLWQVRRKGRRAQAHDR